MSTNISEMLAAVVAEAPDSTAIVDDATEMSFGELDASINAIASWLLDRSFPPETIVALQMKRSASLIAAMFGVLRAGFAFLPLDSELPLERLDYVIRHSRTPLVIVDDALRAATIPTEKVEISTLMHCATSQNVEIPFPEPHGTQLAYCIYTSGTTGKPKGVAVSHNSLAAFRHDMFRLMGHQKLGWLSLTSPAFDISILELLLPLTFGGRVVIGPRPNDTYAIQKIIASNLVGIVQATPSTWRLLLEIDKDVQRSITAIVGGDRVSLELCQQLKRYAKRVIHVYGPTETTIWSSWWEVPESPGQVVLGQAFDSERLQLGESEAESLQPLAILGGGLARGYLHDAGATARSFRPANSGDRLYVTGDLVRQMSGKIIFAGRDDQQVKILGYRIELTEIEVALGTLPGVSDAIAATVGTPGGVVVGALVEFDGETTPQPSTDELQRSLSLMLPKYMLPGIVHSIDRIPTTWNGKGDRHEAKRILERSLSHRLSAARPSSDLAEVVKGIWQEILPDSEDPSSGTFMSQGGDSMQAFRLLLRVYDSFGIWVRVDSFLLDARLEFLTGLVKKRQTESEDQPISRRS
ncbi:non-ribosomal peptide synthetase (plasmid) [Glutamicibacter sp. FR1]|uniref:non-ribosomal peptide synthetase n=1 Tax=Glutamicibacter sp. FR1 TaxID=3393744 RepID=UPI0039AF35D9